jgi:protein tyrosine phosphatase (PTP) superfamily phosphohydrolase (DUF442 family)
VWQKFKKGRADRKDEPMRPDTLPIVVVTLVGVILWADEDAPATRPDHWAQPVEIDGVPNLFKLSDELYRSAQPSAGGMQRLKERGVKTVVNLRSFHSDRDEIGDTGLGYEHIYMKSWHPEDKELVRFLQIVTNKERTPVLVHCQHGADRTGLMCAVYRVAVQGWTKDDAITEMTAGGFGFSPIWTNIVQFLRDLNVEDIKQRAGL